MISAGTAGLIATGASAAASLYNTYQQGKQNEANIQYQKDYNARQEQLYKEKLEYNSPVQQAKRYQDAGFNPHVIAGQISAGNAAQLPNQQPLHRGKKSTDLGLAPTTGLQAYGMASQVENMIAQNDNLHAQNSLITSQKSYYDMQALSLGKKMDLIPFQKASYEADRILKQIEAATAAHNLDTVKNTPIPTNATSFWPMIGRAGNFLVNMVKGFNPSFPQIKTGARFK